MQSQLYSASSPTSALHVSPLIQQLLCCPKCYAPLSTGNDKVIACKDCSTDYPIVDGSPILFNEELSTFSSKEIIDSYIKEKSAAKPSLKKQAFTTYLKFLPHIPSFKQQKSIVQWFVEYVKEKFTEPSILVLGSGTDAIGLQELREVGKEKFCETDIFLYPGRMLVSDIHQIPFASNSFDVVVVQGVLEHVLDPQHAVSEIHRVLKPGGLVFSLTPFMLGVHMSAADFTRFSRLGLLRLFRNFTPVKCEAAEGPGVSLAYAFSYFMMTLFSANGSLRGAKIAKYLCNFFVFWLRYVDKFTRKSPIWEDAASSIYYVGSKSSSALTDKQVFSMFKGAGLCPW